MLIQILDEQWRDHLNELIMLRSGIGLRSYGQRDPLVEYKGESFRMFEALVGSIEKSAINLFFRAELAPPPERPATPPPVMQTKHQEVSAFGSAATEPAPDEDAIAGAAPAGRQRALGQRRAQRPLPLRQRQEVQEVLRRRVGVGPGRGRPVLPPGDARARFGHVTGHGAGDGKRCQR